MSRFILILGIVINAFPLFAQWEEAGASISFKIPELALVDIEPEENNNVHFTILPSNEAGDGSFNQVINSAGLFINYSSSLAHPNSSRSISAQIINGTLPEGIRMFIEAKKYSGSGKGRTGKSTGKQELTQIPAIIIDRIGSCFTGDGINNGHELEFSIEVTGFEELFSTEESVFSILYTITDN